MASPIISRIQANVFEAQNIVIDDKYERTVLKKISGRQQWTNWS